MIVCHVARALLCEQRFFVPRLSNRMHTVTKQNLDTPALCLDLDVLESNIARMAATCRENGVDWRPHCKCHKSSWIARQLLKAGAIGMTCAKLGEAEVMARGGITDLLIANQIVGAQ